jgi:hypothetical protein
LQAAINPAVARTDIDQNVPRLDVRQIEHGIHHIRGGRDERYIRDLRAILSEEHDGHGE